MLKFKRLAYGLVSVFMVTLVAAPVQAASTSTTLDVAAASYINITGDPYQGSSADMFNDYPNPLTMPLPSSTGLLPLGSTGNNGFDAGFVVPLAASGCTRVLNSVSFSITMTGEETAGDVKGFGIGLSTDSGSSFNQTGTFSSGLQDVFGNSGFAVGQVSLANSPVVSTQTFSTPINVDNQTLYIVAFEAPAQPDLLQYSLDHLTFNVTDTCEDVAVPVTPVEPAPTASATSTEAEATLAETGQSTGLIISLVTLNLIGALIFRRKIKV